MNKSKFIKSCVSFLMGFTAAFTIFFFTCLNTGDEKNTNTEIKPSASIVCIHGNNIYDLSHNCDHMIVLRSTDSYDLTFQYPSPEKCSIDDNKIESIQKFIQAIETCKEETLIYELSENDIEDWPQFEWDVMCYCANYYIVDEDLTGDLADMWSSENNGRSYVELDISRCKKVMELCRKEPERRRFIENSVKEAVRKMKLTGSKVHDLKVIHDYVCESVSYDESYDNTTVYEFFKNGKTLCNGYSQVFQLICRYVGMDVDHIIGYVGKENITHAWNSIEIDGKTYYIDCTWSDMDEEGIIIYEDFLKTESSGVEVAINFIPIE